jgi:hypothetical protein
VVAEKFVRVENARGLRRNLNSPPLPPVLREFQVTQAAGSLVLLDGDGSAFRITTELDLGVSASVASLAQALKKLDQPLPFKASGLSQSAGEVVTFEGWLEPRTAPGPASAAAPELSGRSVGIHPLEATQVRGEVQVGTRQRFPMVARIAGD